jgi:hypothetical protein
MLLRPPLFRLDLVRTCRKQSQLIEWCAWDLAYLDLLRGELHADIRLVAAVAFLV